MSLRAPARASRDCPKGTGPSFSPAGRVTSASPSGSRTADRPAARVPCFRPSGRLSSDPAEDPQRAVSGTLAFIGRTPARSGESGYRFATNGSLATGRHARLQSRESSCLHQDASHYRNGRPPSTSANGRTRSLPLPIARPSGPSSTATANRPERQRGSRLPRRSLGYECDRGRAPTRGPATMRDLDLEPRTGDQPAAVPRSTSCASSSSRAHRQTQERTD